MCPVCKSDLGINEKGNLLCKGCGEEYPIINGIPVLNLPFPEMITYRYRKFKKMDIKKVEKEHLRIWSTKNWWCPNSK